MQFLNTLSYRAKIQLLVVPAIVGLLVLGWMRISSNLEASANAEQTQWLTELSTYNSLLLHEMQKERGATAGFLGSKGAQFGDIVQNQRKQTDNAARQRNAFLQEQQDDIEIESIRNAMAGIASALTKLGDIRRQVDDLSIPADQAIGYYTQTNAKIIAIIPLVAHTADNGEVVEQLVAFYNFLEGKERAGVERAVMTKVFTQDRFGEGDFPRFVTLVAEQNVYFKEFENLAVSQLLDPYKRLQSDSAVVYVNQKRALAKNRTSQFGVTGTEWFSQATNRINGLKKLEDNIAQYLLDTTHELANASRTNFRLTLLIGGLLMAFVLLVAFKMSMVITEQIRAMEKTISVIESDADLTQRIDVTTSDEVGHIAQVINGMLESFRSAVSEIEKCSSQLAASSEQTAVSTQSNMESLQNQQEQTQLVATAVEEMTASIQEVATNTAKTAGLVSDVDRSVDDSIADITRSRDEMEKLSSEMGNTNNLISQLQSSSSNINSVVEVIKSVAEQTNLLALNAAIEAARAGEQGRGFAVVADEVRTLAQRTQESTAEIEAMVGRFQQDAVSVSESIARCSDEVVIAVEQTRQLEAKLNTIGDAATAITDMSAQVATATEEQVAVASEMASNVTSISDFSDQNVTSGTQIAGASQEQTRLAESLAELANRFKC